jgi:dienelactone hydrolase
MARATRHVRIPLEAVTLEGDLTIPRGPHGLVVFAHGSGSSRHSPRNLAIASALNATGLATLLFDLLTLDEEAVDRMTAHLRFDIGWLAHRLVAATDWLAAQDAIAGLPIGYFGASTGAGAALVAAAARPTVAAVVARGGRPDLAGPALAEVKAPTLLIVGGADTPVIELNRRALAQLGGVAEMQVVPGASHLFEEPGTLEAVARRATAWFGRHLVRRRAA